MNLSRITHAVPDYAGQKKDFESDPVGRKKSDGRSYLISI